MLKSHDVIEKAVDSLGNQKLSQTEQPNHGQWLKTDHAHESDLKR